MVFAMEINIASLVYIEVTSQNVNMVSIREQIKRQIPMVDMRRQMQPDA